MQGLSSISCAGSNSPSQLCAQATPSLTAFFQGLITPVPAVLLLVTYFTDVYALPASALEFSRAQALIDYKEKHKREIPLVGLVRALLRLTHKKRPLPFLQLTSSEPSTQSRIPLHCLLPWMQLPSSHSNWSGLQVREATKREGIPWNEASQIVPSWHMEEKQICHTDERATYDSWLHRCHLCSQDPHHIATSCGCTHRSHTGSRWPGTWCVSLAGGHTALGTHLIGPSSLHHRRIPSCWGCRRRCCTGTRGRRRWAEHSPAHRCRRYSHPDHCIQNSWRCSGHWSKWTHQGYTLCYLLRERMPHSECIRIGPFKTLVPKSNMQSFDHES